jgi:hypothetical protein
VAILSAPDFDATTVDPETVTLASAPVKLKGKGTPLFSFEDIDEDGTLGHCCSRQYRIAPTR